MNHTADISDSIYSADRAASFNLITAEMGYGHIRAVYPLRFLSADGTIRLANRMESSSLRERFDWKRMQNAYEFISRARNFPAVGFLFSALMDAVLFIPDYYPVKERKRPTIQSWLHEQLLKQGLCNGVLEYLNVTGRPLLTSFYSPAIVADMAGHDRIYCIICDTDLSRVWVPKKPERTRIVYFAPGTMAVKRLQSYGVPRENIVLTGFPLPLELLGDRSLNVLRRNLIRRLVNLDPNRFFMNLYGQGVETFIGRDTIQDIHKAAPEGKLTITYAVGGAGAQQETGKLIVESLAGMIETSEVCINLVAGTRSSLNDYFQQVRQSVNDPDKNISVIYAEDINEYLEKFNDCLHSTDILWTKPSELSFYSALGLPIIVSPPIGPQEKYNQRWLRDSGVGFKQKDPRYTGQWLFELLGKGRLAEAAWLGFLKGRKYGTYNIMDYLANGKLPASNDPLAR